MATKLHISKSFTLPLDLLTSTQAILARKRSGKSYLASVEAEELLDAKQQIAVIDPTGAWWGLRSNAAGDGPGYPVVVFGGDHAGVTQAGTGLPERIMRELYTHYPNAVSRDQLSAAVKASGGYYNNTVGTMKTAGFIEYPSPGAVRLQPWTQMQ